MKLFFAIFLLAFESVSANVLFAASVAPDEDAGSGASQGGQSLVPPLDLTTYHVTSLIQSRYVTTRVDAVYVNTARVLQEATFTFKITPTAYISGFSIDVDGTIYPAEIMEKEAAREAIKDAKKRGQSAGYEKESRHPLKFSVGIMVAPDSTVIFHLFMVDLLRRNKGIYTHQLNIAPGQIAEDLQVETQIMESQGITHINSFWMPSFDQFQSAIDTTFQKMDDEAGVTFSLTADQQRSVDPNKGINGILVTQYTLKSQPIQGNLQSNGGYFAHFISPENLPASPKKVVFVIDISGSMAGQKIALTKIALEAILRQLRESDEFNILVFSSLTESWQPYTVPVTKNSVNEAIEYVGNLTANGGTNIYDGLVSAAAEFDKGEPFFPAIIFMTDGIPSEGVTDTEVIIQDVTDAIDEKAALFSVGFGDDVDAPMLRRLSAANRGLYRKVANNENAARKMEGFFQEVSSALLYNIRVAYDDEAVPEETLTQNEFISLFNGSEIIIAGKYADVTPLTGNLTALSADGEVYIPFAFNTTERTGMPNLVEDYTERIWAYLTVRELVIKERLATDPVEKETLKERAVTLSLKYQLVSPVTALVFYPPLDGSPGQSGANIIKDNEVWGDPHFLVDIPGKNLTICFNVQGDEGTIVNLVSDPVLDILVNARLTLFHRDQPEGGNGAMKTTLLNRFGVKLGHHRVDIAPRQVFVDAELSYSYRKPRTIALGEYTVEIKEKGLVTISRGSGIAMNFQRRIWKDHPTHFDFSMPQEAGFSDRVHGILGQFRQKPMELIDAARRVTKTGMVQGVMRLNDKDEAFVNHRRNYTARGYDCWFANADTYLDGQEEQYQVPTLFDHMKQLFA